MGTLDVLVGQDIAEVEGDPLNDEDWLQSKSKQFEVMLFEDKLHLNFLKVIEVDPADLLDVLESVIV